MLSCDNICHGGEGLGIRQKEVGVEGLADAEEQVGVDGGPVIEALQGARGDTDVVGKPFIGVALAAQLVADKVAYVYLHNGCYLCAWLPNPHKHSDDRRQKKKASNLVSCLRSWKLPFVDRQNARLSASICTLAFHKST